jgi:glycogen operon protein
MRDVEQERRRISLNQWLRDATKAWHGVRLGQPDWSHCSHSLAFGAELPAEGVLFHMILNAYWGPLEFELPPPAGGSGPWRRWVDTVLDSPNDIVEWRSAVPVSGATYHAGPRSVAILISGRRFET